MSAIAEVGSEVSTAPLCSSLGVSRAALYRWRQPKLATEPKPARARHPRSLDPHERQAILDTLNSERFCDASPAEVHATLLEEDTYLGSTRTMYRVLADAHEVRERRDQLRHPSYAKPELLATQPNQVWSWDITKLKGPIKWSYFYLFVVLDIFSRYVVGWMVARGEGARLAERLIEETCAKQNISPGQLTIHADRGSAMTSKTVALLFSDLDILRSHSRPHVSDDNPFSESHFRTLKYRPEFPDRFGSLEHARQVCRPLFAWYNAEHHHSALAFLTPATVHHGRADQVLDARHRVRLAAYAVHPERFVNGPPRRQSLPNAVWINPPENTTHQDAPGSTQTDPGNPEVVPVCRTCEPCRRPQAGQLDSVSIVEPAH
jgi:putative transposase